MDVLERSLYKGFIDKNIANSVYDPKIIINNPDRKEFFLNTLQAELELCDDFFFSIAFITQSGLSALKTQVSDLNQRGIKGKILTSTFLAFNKPEVFEDLLNLPNVEVKISDKKGFHAKGYLFTQRGYQSFIIGSSNLTMNALKINYEWNIRLTSYDHGDVIYQLKNDLTTTWNEARPLTKAWINEYRQNYQPILRKTLEKSVVEDNSLPYIVPNKMQTAALNNLKILRSNGEKKGLIISATGTGKTFLAAFDVLQFKPKKMLFIVHREQILNKAMADFKKIIGGEDTDFGILSGNRKDVHATYLFATIQTISKEKYLHGFLKNSFDYILIDEVHKAGAQSYLKVLDYFEPEFLLGMTATPERTGKDERLNIFELFDYNVAYEIRLQEALEEELLCPFHYFGVTDYERNGEIISETSDLQDLVTHERVNFLIEKIHYYGCYENNPKGLVFCSQKEEAKKLSQSFNERGFPSTYLTGDHSIEEREKQVILLEEGKLQYIFTVDIFNEGIDIPKVNQVVMLRNTQSSIIFIQQLGRGLRKDSSKEYVTVIDFIGNYKNNYMIPMALSGDNTRNKNNLRQDTFETNYITGVSVVNFEEIAKERIFESINAASLDSMKELKAAYYQLKHRINKVPSLLDFQQSGVIDVGIIATKYKNYYEFLVKLKENEEIITSKESKILSFITTEILPGMRKQEIVLLQELLIKESLTYDELQLLFFENHLSNDFLTIQSVLKVLSLEFYTGTFRTNYKGAELIAVNQENICLSETLKQGKKNRYFMKLLEDLIKVSEIRSQEYDTHNPLTLYKKYRRRDVLRLLNWEEMMVEQNIGGYTYKEEYKKFVIFVTLEKGDNFQGALLAYEDELLDQDNMKYFTKAPRTINSPEVKIFQSHQDWEFYMFVQKSDDEGRDFYYLGQVEPVSNTIKQEEKVVNDGKKLSVVQLKLKFKTTIENKLYHYLKEDK